MTRWGRCSGLPEAVVMPTPFSCPRGHRGEIIFPGNLSAAPAALVCPVCGSAVQGTEAPDRLAGPEPDPGRSAARAADPGDLTFREGDGLGDLPTLVTLPPLPPSPATGFPAVPGYTVLGELGRGGMGVVYKARQTRLNRLVALKMVLAGSHARPEEVVRFLREAEAV